MNVMLYESSYNEVKGFLNKETPSFGFSLRDLTSNNLICVRVRRTSDNDERDFRPLDITNGELLSYVGDGNEGFVARWVNQFNQDEYYEQTDTSKQPQIVYNVGGTATLVTTNAVAGELPSIDFGGFGFVTNGFLEGGDYEPSQDLLIIAVIRPQAIDPSSDGYIFDNFTSSGRGLLQDNFSSGTYTFINDTTSSTPNRLRAGVPSTDLTVITARIKSDAVTLANNQWEMYFNGVLAVSDNGTLLPYQARSGSTNIGAGTGSGSDPFLGRISEILIYRGNNLDYTQKIVEKNVIGYYADDLNL